MVKPAEIQAPGSDTRKCCEGLDAIRTLALRARLRGGASTDSAAEIIFTRAERALLQVFVRNAGRLAESGWTCIRNLTRELDRGTAPGNRVALDLDCPAAEAFEGEVPVFAVDLSFLKVDRERLDCAVALRHFATRTLLKVTRVRMGVPGAGEADPYAVARRLAAELLDAIWLSLNYADDGVAVPADEPLDLRLQTAALALTKGRVGWNEIERRLESAVFQRGVERIETTHFERVKSIL